MDNGDTAYFNSASCDIDEFERLTAQLLTIDDLRFAATVEKNVPIYDAKAFSDGLREPAQRKALMAEWAWVLGKSAGVLAIRSAYLDTAPVDRASGLFDAIIAREKEQSGGGGDHFAQAGANDRIWNALQKHCERDAESFAFYYGNPVIAAVCEAWLGPNYQMTAQVNLVRPGGAAQEAHRDYHLGFQTAEIAETYPAHMHDLSAALTLQGAVAHTDMPVESGPTKLLPFSQLYRSGYVAWRRQDFRDHFEANFVQLPLSKGDAVFFNPALFHAAGANVTNDVQRMANLLQVSSAFGRAMERVDRTGMTRRLYPVLKALGNRLDPLERQAAIAACGEGYSFPTNLDLDPPVGGLAPETQAALTTRALAEDWPIERFESELNEQDERRSA